MHLWEDNFILEIINPATGEPLPEGQTARVTKLLADVGVSLCWLTIANSGSFGVMTFLVDQRDLAVQTLKETGLMVSLLEVLAVMPVQRGNASSFGATRGRGSISNTTCFRRTV